MGNDKIYHRPSKKKIETQIETYFPDLEGREVNTFYTNLKVKAQNDLKYILGEDVEKGEETRIEDYFYSLLKPTVFWGQKGKEVMYYRDFEQTCNLMRQYGVPEPKKLTTREWFQYLADLRKQLKPSKNGRQFNNRK